MKKNQKILLGVGIIGLAGYMIYKQNQKPKNFANLTARPILNYNTTDCLSYCSSREQQVKNSGGMAWTQQDYQGCLADCTRLNQISGASKNYVGGPSISSGMVGPR